MVSKTKTVLVTGARGFIGKELVTYLAGRGYSIRALVRSPQRYRIPNIEAVMGDMRDINSLVKATLGVDAVVHLAASKNDEKNSFQTNVGGAKNLVAACIKNNVSRIINVSTASTTLRYLGTYGQTKKAADNVFKESSLEVTTLKPSIVYGNFEDGVFGTLAKATQKPVVPIFGNGESLFRPIHIEDLAIIIERCLNKKNTVRKEYDVGGPDIINFKQMARKIGRLRSNKTIKFIYLPMRLGMLVANASSLMSKPLLTRSNILGLVQTASLDTDIYVDIDFIPRSFNIGLQNIILRESYLEEPKLMYNYLFSFAGKSYRLDDKEIRDYWVALANNHIGRHRFSRMVYKRPFLLGGLDAVSKILYPKSTLQKKLMITAALIETNTQSASELLSTEKSISRLMFRSGIIVSRAIGKILLGFTIMFAGREFFKKNVR